MNEAPPASVDDMAPSRATTRFFLQACREPPEQTQEKTVADQKPTHIPAEGEGTPLQDDDTDLAPAGKPGKTDDEGELPPFDPQMGVATEQG